MMKFTINIEKKHFYVLLSLFILVFGIVGVQAFNSGQAPGVFGHSAEELLINIDGVDKTLQQAIADGDFVTRDTLPLEPFAGAFTNRNDGCRNPNPLTGQCSCPPGYEVFIMQYDNAEGFLHHCILNGVVHPSMFNAATFIPTN